MSHYTAVTLQMHDGRMIDIDLRYEVGAFCKSVWTVKLRALRRACKKLGIDLKHGDWAYMGGNMWSASDILNA